MARIRTIKPEFAQSETIGKLSRDARLLFVLLWTFVDDLGRCRGSSRLLAANLFPYDTDVMPLIDGWLTELEALCCIRRYVIDGDTYLDIPNWQKHQRVDNAGKSRIPEFRGDPPRDSANVCDPPLYLGPRTLGPRKEDTASAVPSKVYFFESGIIRLSEEDFKKWEVAFSNLSLRAELLSLTEWAGEQGAKWFFALSGALAKRNREIGLRIKTAEKSEPKVPAFDRPWTEAIS